MMFKNGSVSLLRTFICIKKKNIVLLLEEEESNVLQNGCS